MNGTTSKYLKAFLQALLLFSFYLLVSCGSDRLAGGGSDIGNPGPVAAVSFGDEAELETYLKAEFAGSAIPTDTYSYFSEDSTTVSPSAPANGGSNTAVSSPDSSDYSETNIQEAGVDEADKVKTDGEYFYIAKEQTVKIVKAVPTNDMAVVHTIAINGAVDSLYLYNDTLAVIYTPPGYGGGNWPHIAQGLPAIAVAADVGMPYWLPVQAKTGVVFYDISTPAAPVHLREVVAEGSLISSRLTGGKLLLVQQFMPDLPPIQLWYDGTESDKTAVIQSNTDALDATTLADLAPSYQEFDADNAELASGLLVEPANFYRPEDPEGGTIVTIASFDLKSPGIPLQATGMVADANQIYASTSALYLASYKWQWLADSSTSRESTTLHKFDISGDKAVWQAGGWVNGRILNQFSMGEYQDVLRVAASTGSTWDGSSKNHIYCLSVNAEELEIIGSIENLAPGEKIYSARFLGKRGYLVTFVKVDPLFTIDLSDPTNPQVMGELKVPGYSDYIHPLGENHILTIGKDAVEQNGVAWYQGLQMSVFDVNDFSNPQLLHKELLGDRGTESEALHNHKAFTFWADQDLLALPVNLYEHNGQPSYPSSRGDFTFSGLYIYRVTVANGFELVGRISTQGNGLNNYGYWTRGIFIDTNVFAVNQANVFSAELADLVNTVESLSLE